MVLSVVVRVLSSSLRTLRVTGKPSLSLAALSTRKEIKVMGDFGSKGCFSFSFSKYCLVSTFSMKNRRSSSFLEAEGKVERRT